MRLKIFVNMGLAIVLGLIAITTASLIVRSSQITARQDEREIPIVAEQLPFENGVFPVELRCGNARLTAPNRIDGFSCLVINNTNKNISALSATYTVTTIEGGKKYSNTNVLNIDTFMHPDIREARNLKSFSPKESRSLQPPGAITYENAVVEEVKIHIDYVELDDNSSLGLNKHGSKIIHSIREGAARYKAWLVQQYVRNKKEDGALVQLLESPDIPQELQSIKDDEFIEGIRIYKKVMRNVYDTQGAAELKKFLNR